MLLLNEPNIEQLILVVSSATFTLTLRKFEGNISKKSEGLMEDYCLYCTALNKQNAIKKFEKMIDKIIKQQKMSESE